MKSDTSDMVSKLKKLSLYVVFVIEIILLFRVIFVFIERQKYFSLSSDFAIPFVLILVISLWTIGIITQTLDKKWEVLVAPAIVCFSSFIFLSKFKIAEALIGSTLSSLYFLYAIQKTKSVGDNLIKVKVSYSGKYAAKVFLLAVSILTSLSVFLMSKNISSIDVGKWAADMIEKPVREAIEEEYKKEVPEEITSLNLYSLKESNPQIAAVLNSFGITELPANISLPESTTEGILGTIKNSISSQVNKAVEPYRVFFSPTLALLVFGLLQMYNYVVYFIYSNTIGLVLILLKRIGFIKLETITTTKEILKI